MMKLKRGTRINLKKTKMKCCKCEIKLRKKDAKRLKDGKYCKKCYVEKRNKNREYLKRSIDRKSVV